MTNDDIRLYSVNWELGMLLTPDHFRRQDQYVDSAVRWILRYATNSFGLIGGGPRLPETERGATRYDPIVSVDQDDKVLSLAVSQCRGLTPAGCIVDIGPEAVLRRSFEKVELEGVSECVVYVVVDANAKVPLVAGVKDEANPGKASELAQSYRIKVQVSADEAPYSLAVARIRRVADGVSFEKNDEYIPACTTMLSHSSLAAMWRQIAERVESLSRRYMALHEAMQHFIGMSKQRGIDTASDFESMQFVGRMVVALENCLYEVLDASQSPQRLFAQIARFTHSATVYVTLSPPIGEYFEQLKAQGETECVNIIEEQKRSLQVTPKWKIHDDVGVEGRAAIAKLDALGRLERALSGKYADFRLNTYLEATNYFFERDGNTLYRLAGRAQRAQAYDGRLTLVFAGLRLESRSSFRVVLTADSSYRFETNTRVSIEIRINEGAGYKRDPIFRAEVAALPGQCNMPFDFEANDVPLISDLKVYVDGHFPIHTGLLFTRQFFYANKEAAAPQPVTPQPVAQPQQPPTPPTPPGPIRRW